MIVFKLVKFIFKIFLGIALGVLLVIWCVVSCTGWVRSGQTTDRDVSKMISEYNICTECPPGTFLQCPVCDKPFYKADINFCSKECEHNYWEIKEGWDNAQNGIKTIESYDKNFR